MIFALAACGSSATPTMSMADAANTAAAAAWIAVTQTVAAMPTATETPVPPTPLPSPTSIPTIAFVLPTVAVPTLPAATAANPCNDPPPAKPKGTTVKVKLNNQSGGSVNLSLGMTDPNDQGECGTYGFSLSKYDAPVVTILAGCYWGYGWVTGDKPSTTQTANIMCLTDTTKTVTIAIGPETLGLQ